jgi:NAD(P)H-flavin reductase
MEAVIPEPPGHSDVSSFKTRIIARRSLSPNAFELSLAKPPDFTFIPGQRVRLQDARAERDYSIASAPAEDAIRLCIRKVEMGRLSAQLAEAPAGTAVTFTGPHGYFTFKPSARQAVFVATGTGIAPFCAMAAAGISGFILLHGVARAQDLYYRDVLLKKASAYTPCLSEDQAPAADHYDGRVTGYMQYHLPPRAYDFYLCGRQDMVRDATLLTDERFPGSLVFTEIFY